MWLWIAYNRERKEVIAFTLGCRGKKTGRELWKQVKGINCSKYATDDWKPYTTFIPSDRHTISKSETYIIESFNCNVRHYLARFRRKTRCYSKCSKMVEYSLYILFWKKITMSMF